MEKPYEMLEALLAKRYPYFLLDRTMARPGLRDELYIQHVPPAIYRASYPVWFLNAQKIEELVQSHGYKLVERVDPYPGSTFGSPQKSWPYMSWYFEQVK
jgi:putative methyltransferase (TIGR04325 family)